MADNNLTDYRIGSAQVYTTPQAAVTQFRADWDGNVLTSNANFILDSETFATGGTANVRMNFDGSTATTTAACQIYIYADDPTDRPIIQCSGVSTTTTGIRFYTCPNFTHINIDDIIITAIDQIYCILAGPLNGATTVSITNCRLYGCYSYAVYIPGITVNMVNCELINCFYMLVLIANSTINATGCYFSRCFNLVYSAAAVANAAVNLVNCTGHELYQIVVNTRTFDLDLDSCYLVGNGTHLLYLHANSTLVAKNSYIAASGNWAILIYADNIELTYCTIEGGLYAYANATDGTIENCAFLSGNVSNSGLINIITITNWSLDYNAYCSNSYNACGFFWNGVNYDADAMGFAAYQAASGQDANSHSELGSIEPTTYTGVNYQTMAKGSFDATVANNAKLVGQGTPIVGITDDINGNVRDAANPTIGCFEYDSEYPIATLEIVTQTMADAVVDAAYEDFIYSTGGVTPYDYTVIVGALPVGLTLTALTGKISGTPTATGVTNFTVQNEDDRGIKATRALLIDVIDKPTIEHSSAAIYF